MIHQVVIFKYYTYLAVGRDHHGVHQMDFYGIHQVDLFKYLLYLIYSVVAGIIIGYFVIFDIFGGWEGLS